MTKIAPRKLWQSIDNAIVQKLVDSAFEETPHQFLPEGELNQILDGFSDQFGSPRDIISILLRLRAPVDTEDKQSILDHILNPNSPALKLFFALLRAKHEYPYEAMRLFMRKPIRDVDCPIPWSTQEDFYYNLASLEGWDEDIWTSGEIKNFQDNQRLFHAPVLTTDVDKMPGQFGQSTLPFIKKDPGRAKGGFCVVSQYTIHSRHLDVNDKTTTDHVVAVKELNNDGSDVARHWTREVRALSKMNVLNKEHIIRFITAFTRGKAEEEPKNLKHYVVFEWADGGNLRKLWEQFPHPGREAAFVKWIMEQLYGLSQALSAAHYLLNDKGEYKGASYRHGDIKPENILWFPSEGGGRGTLKICDWGEAKNHDDATRRRPNATTAQFATRRYEAPEILGVSVPASSVKGVRSRLYDIWSMGCVMLECIIWLVYGLEELRRFNKDNRGDHGLSDNFYETHGDETLVHTIVHGAVNRWINHMTTEPFGQPGKTAVGDVLDIVSKGLLVVRLPQGDLKAAEVEHFHRTHPMAPQPTSLPHPLAMPVPNGLNATKDHMLNKATSVQHTTEDIPRKPNLATGLPVPVIRYNDLQSEPEGDSLAVKVTPAESVEIPLEKPLHSGEPQRYRATELAHRLGKLVTDPHDNEYWLIPDSPAKVPPPKQATASYLSPNSAIRPQGSSGRNMVTKQNVKGDYKDPELNRERWTFELDNDFAKNLLSTDRTQIQTPGVADSTTTELCETCAQIQERLWSPLFNVVLAKDKVKENASSELCSLCCLLWKACKAIERNEITLQLSASNLVTTGTQMPVISLFRKNIISTANALQIGFAELPEPGKRAHLATIRAWVVDCDDNHTEPVCKPQTDGTARTPTRLIDVGSEHDDCVRLRPTRDDDHLQWIALSYRWGDHPNRSMTTWANIDDHIKGMKVTKLPYVFQDAIHMTRSLGFRYLWIDAVCIVQGMDGDFATESKRMEDVYSGAYCVLAASYASSHRLFHPRKARPYVTLGSDQSSVGVIYACEAIDDFKSHVLDSPLSLRGWVLQEHALARRTIFFTEHQTYWECGHGIRCETMKKLRNSSAALLGDPNFPSLFRSADHGKKILQYQELYQRYSRLELTSDYDRPAAINGLERRLLRAMGTNGGFGVFDDHDNPGLLRRSLMWCRATETLGTIDFPQGREKIPSWSWMSVSGPIDYVPLEFAKFEWTKIQSPWSNQNAIIAHARRFSAPKLDFSSGIDVKLDNGSKNNHGGLLTVTLGIEKCHKDLKDRQHCVLIVEVTSDSNASIGIQCRRVGAGLVQGKYLEEEVINCSVI